MSSFDFKMLKWPAYLTDSAAAIVTNAVTKKTQIHTIICHNTDTGSRIVTIYLVQNNAGAVGTASDSNMLVKATVPANDTFTWEFAGSDALILYDTNDTLQALADVASKVVISVKGAVVTG